MIINLIVLCILCPTDLLCMTFLSKDSTADSDTEGGVDLGKVEHLGPVVAMDSCPSLDIFCTCRYLSVVTNVLWCGPHTLLFSMISGISSEAVCVIFVLLCHAQVIMKRLAYG